MEVPVSGWVNTGGTETVFVGVVHGNNTGSILPGNHGLRFALSVLA